MIKLEWLDSKHSSSYPGGSSSGFSLVLKTNRGLSPSLLCAHLCPGLVPHTSGWLAWLTH